MGEGDAGLPLVIVVNGHFSSPLVFQAKNRAVHLAEPDAAPKAVHFVLVVRALRDLPRGSVSKRAVPRVYVNWVGHQQLHSPTPQV